MKNVLFALLVSAVLSTNPAFSTQSVSLSGRYIVNDEKCLNFLNGESGVSSGAFNVGDQVELRALPNELALLDLRTRALIRYQVGTFNETGPVSDGPQSKTNRYFDNGSKFSTGNDNHTTGDNFAKYVYVKYPQGIQIFEVSASGAQSFCTLTE